LTSYWTPQRRRNNRLLRYFIEAGVVGLDKVERRHAMLESGVGSIGGWFVTPTQPGGFLEWIEPQRTHACLTENGVLWARERLAAEKEDRIERPLAELKRM
jgi:hypothetical protein